MSNVDSHELDKFSQYAHSWWDKKGPAKPLHDINPLRLEFIKSQSLIKDSKLIDVGCGGGILTEALANAGANCTGLDLNKDLINVAKLHLHESNLEINYQLESIENYAKVHKEQFDVLTCMELLEHVPSPRSIIQACSDLVKPGGKLFFATINRNIKSYLFAIVGAEYILNMLDVGTHEYAKFIKPSELNRYAETVDLRLKKIQGMSYHPIFKEYELSADVSVNYLICFEKNYE